MIYLNSWISWFWFQRVEPCQVDMGVVWWHFLRLRHFHSISETPFDSIFGVNRWCRGLIPQPVRYRICLITSWVAQSFTHVIFHPLVHSMYRFAWLFSGDSDIIKIFKNHQPMIPWSTWIQHYWFCFQRVEPCQVDLGVAWWHFLRLRHFHSISETPFDSIFGVNRWCRGLIPQPVRYRTSLITEWVARSCTHVPPTGTQPVPICMVVFWWYNKNI